MGKTPLFETRAFQIDIARQPQSLKTLKRIIKKCAGFHFNQCHLYIENCLRLDSFREAGRGLTKKEIRELIDFAGEGGVEVVPSLNLLGHAERFLTHSSFAHMSEVREGPRHPWQNWNDCLCPSLEDTRKWAASVIAEVAEIFPSVNLHAGLDETFELGSCSLCRKRAEKEGIGGVYAEHANFINGEIRKHGRIMWMWADMCFYYENLIERLSKDIVMVDWYYDTVKSCPEFDFLNWRRIDSTNILLENGFRVALGGKLGVLPDIENTVTFARYGEGLGIDTYLATEWEGGGRFQDNVMPNRCMTGHILWAGRIPSWEEVGKHLLPGYAKEEQRSFFMSLMVRDDNYGAANDALKAQKQSVLHKAVRSEVLRKSVECGKKKVENELRYTARNMIRRGYAESKALFLQMDRLNKVIAECGEWGGLLGELAAYYGERKEDREIYGKAEEMLKELTEMKRKAEIFGKNPVHKNYPFAPMEIVLETLTMDLCATACRIQISYDGKSYEKIYDVAALPLGSEKSITEIRIPVKAFPFFVRLSIGGYARIGVTGIRCETPEAEVFPKNIIEFGGAVIDPLHLLAWDRKAALFNEPDVESKWKQDAKEHQENYVLLKF
ncbi:MAG: family 20 glycosylhydrolase [Candidatus Omnitrophica bacterium]|nr:family 20 glycosylhydrolase [Candidatus Omnitrophota bacterium]